MEEVTVGLGALALLVGFPLLLLGMLALLGALEHWMLEPDERATQVQQLLDERDEADDVEKAVTRLLAQLADRHDTTGGNGADTNTSTRRVPQGDRPGD